MQYITIPQNSSTIQIYDTDDTTLLKTIKVTNICEPKFTPYKITFLNNMEHLRIFISLKRVQKALAYQMNF